MKKLILFAALIAMAQCGESNIVSQMNACETMCKGKVKSFEQTFAVKDKPGKTIPKCICDSDCQ
jgi:hypothetical protein